jgi:hypothetical protein
MKSMISIELTDAQRQAVEAEPGRPVQVVDPATKQRYVLLAREQYERVRSLLVGSAEAASSPASPAAGPPSEGRPYRQRVRDLPLPPAVAAAAQRYCQRLGLWGAKSRREMEEQMKLQHYYGGTWIAYLRTDEGPVVVGSAASLSDPAFDQQLSFLTADERRGLILESPVRLFDQESELLTPFLHEGSAPP